MKKFLLERSNLQMIGLAALEEVVNDEVSIIQILQSKSSKFFLWNAYAVTNRPQFDPKVLKVLKVAVDNGRLLKLNYVLSCGTICNSESFMEFHNISLYGLKRVESEFPKKKRVGTRRKPKTN